MTTQQDLPELASDPPAVLRMSGLLRDLQARSPICKVRTFAGDEGWLVTQHAELMELLHDKRVGRSHPDPANAPRYVKNPFLEMLITDDVENTWKLHHEMRSLLTNNFSARRIVNLTPKVEAVADDILKGFVAQGQPGDLHGSFSEPFSLFVLCELVGIPAEDRGRLIMLLSQMGGLEDGAAVKTGQENLFGFLRELAERRRVEPEDDVISRLCKAEPDTERIIPICAGLLFAGLESVVSHIDLGVVLFALHPEQRDLALSEPRMMTAAVEEILRAAKAGGSALPRYASEDIEIGGASIKAGDLVLLDFTLANADKQVFDSPELFDIHRAPNPHLTFGHGIWHCVGAPLARVELKTAYTKLFTTLPDLKLGKTVEELRLLGGQLSGGLTELPVVW